MELLDVHVFVFDTLSDWETGYVLAGLNNSPFQKGPTRYRVRTFGVTTAPVTTIGGFRIIPDLSLKEVSAKNSSMLILPGGLTWDQGKHREVLQLACDFVAAHIPVAAICAATAALARAGILDTRKHTSNAAEYIAATNYLGSSLYVDAPAVCDDGVITASGVAPIDFAKEVFQLLDLFTPQVLNAWLGLFKTGQPEYYAELMRLVTP